MGIPVLTLKGDRFLSRFGESIAQNAGQTEWIANDLQDYESKAVAFASDTQHLSDIRTNLRDKVLQTPLFNVKRFAGNFGDALWHMWKLKCQL
jgi:protein O-GlcNAc transferase